MTTNYTNPKWWTEEHDTAWSATRDDLRATSKVNEEEWKTTEEGVRYGHGAATQYKSETSWNDGVENKLREEWNDLKSGRTWAEIKTAVRRGWDAARSKVSR